jgi:hypothetical protein
MLIRISPKEPTLEITDWPLAICLAMPKADNVRWGSGAKLPNLLWKQASAFHGNRLKMAHFRLSEPSEKESVVEGKAEVPRRLWLTRSKPLVAV